MAISQRPKRFTVSLGSGDYNALRALAEGHKPPLTLQYVVNVAVKDLLDRHESKQLSFPLDR